MLRILGKASSINVRKVLWTCAELDVAYDREDWGSGFRSPETPAFTALNPNAMVPVLIDGDFVLWESNAICRYLAAGQGRDDLLPTRPQERAHVEQWMDWQIAEMNPAWGYAFQALVRRNPERTDPAAIAASAERWTRHVAIVEERLRRTGAFMAGDTFTLADIVIALSVNRWLMTPIAHPSFPAIDVWLARLAPRPGFARYCRNGMP